MARPKPTSPCALLRVGGVSGVGNSNTYTIASSVQDEQRRRYPAQPPSISIAVPVTNSDSSEAR